MYMSGRDQRRALFSLKTIFQNDKDLVHEFVCNGGLECLVQIGRNSDQNHQNHILRGEGTKYFIKFCVIQCNVRGEFRGRLEFKSIKINLLGRKFYVGIILF